MQQLALFPELDLSESIQFDGPDLDSDYIAHGIECYVYEDISNDKVLHKIYRYSYAAQNACERQQLAYKNGIGPAVYGNVQEYDVGYGYATERVSTMELDGMDLYKINHIEKQALKYKLTGLFGNWSDLHNNNIGWNKNGKMVAINFGDCSTAGSS